MSDLHAAEIWSIASQRLRETVTAGTWMTTFQPAQALWADADRVVLEVPNTLVRDRLDGERDILVPALRAASGSPVAVEIVVSESTEPAPPCPSVNARPGDQPGGPAGPGGPGASAPAGGVEPGTLDRANGPLNGAGQARCQLVHGERYDADGFNSDYTFERFVPGEHNRFALAAAMDVAEKPGQDYNPLFLHGGVGLGKTHLLHAIGLYARAMYPHLRIRIVSTEQFTNEFIQSIHHRTQEAFQREIRGYDLLLVDDIQFLERKEGTQNEFFHTFNALRDRGGQIVLTSDGPPRALATVDDRLLSRFGHGLIADLSPPDLETRMAILRFKAEYAGHDIPDEVLNYIATRVKDNIRELEGALTRLCAFTRWGGHSFSVEVAERALSSVLPAPGGPPAAAIDASEIIRACAEHYYLPVSEIVGSRRTRPLTTARHVAMYLCRELTQLSLTDIARAFGKQDHTTIIHALRKISNHMNMRESVFDQIQTITAELKASR